MFVLERHDTRGVDFELLGLGLSVGAILLAWTYPFWRDFYPFACPLKSWTGIPCAFCGGTRAVHAWAHGHALESWLMNPLVSVGAAAATLYLPYALFCVLLRPQKRLRISGFPSSTSPAFRWSIRLGFALVVLANWVYLILDGR